MQGLNPRHPSTFTIHHQKFTFLLQKEKMEWGEGFTQDNEQVKSKGRILIRLSCHPTFRHLLSVLLALGP